MADIEERLKAIEARNSRVDADKAWETSWTRRVTIATLTYGVIVIYLIAIGNDHPWLNALVPTAGYLLSTLALRVVQKVWHAR